MHNPQLREIVEYYGVLIIILNRTGSKIVLLLYVMQLGNSSIGMWLLSKTEEIWNLVVSGHRKS